MNDLFSKLTWLRHIDPRSAFDVDFPLIADPRLARPIPKQVQKMLAISEEESNDHDD
jgi:hypothetical protein